MFFTFSLIYAVIHGGIKRVGKIAQYLLPALLKAWPSGSVKDLCTTGGFEIDIDWKDEKLVKAKVFSKNGTHCKTKYNNQIVELSTSEGCPYILDNDFKPK